MSHCGRRPEQKTRLQAGYSLLFAVFLVATMFIMASVAVPSVLNTGRREREQELIWRGNQYTRGIRLYFHKNGRFPQNKEELIKGSLGVHFIRKVYSDPVAPQNSDWRFIYVAPTGQLTGSVRFHTLQEMAAALGGGPNAASLASLLGGGTPPGAAGAGNTAGNTGAAGAAGAGPGGQGTGSTTGANGGASGTAPGAAAGASNAQGFGGFQPAGSGLSDIPLEAVDGPVLGASLIGVASKVKKDSLLVYQGKENYFQWEFIFNPLLNRGPGGTPGQLPGTAPAGNGAIGGAGGAGAGIAPIGGAAVSGPGAGSMFGPGQVTAPPPGFSGAGRQ